MELIVPFSKYKHDDNAKKLVDYLISNENELSLNDAYLYYNFPLIKDYDEEDKYPDLLIISPYHGLIILQINTTTQRMINDQVYDEAFEKAEAIYSNLLAKLIKIKNLRKRKVRNQLNVPLQSIIFFPNLEELNEENTEGNYWVKELSEIKSTIHSLKIDSIPSTLLDDIYSVIDGSRSLPKPNKREIENNEKDTLKGGVLGNLEEQIAKFDKEQKVAAISTIDGPQRIRGMAGSGKTVVLAMKAALIHLENPESKILYTFYTKSLYDQIKKLITRFYRMFEDHDPDWEYVQIRHAWGGKNLPGVYYDACIDNGEAPLHFTNAKSIALKYDMTPFEAVCYDLLKKRNGKINTAYDYLLMDEGQDFPNTFYWLCRKLVEKDKIIWAYDQLQNILDIDLQETKELFRNEFGDEGINLSDLQKNHPHQNNDIVLHKSYRNPLEILIVAHALGFGIYNERIVQRLENKEHWQDLGYEVDGECLEGEFTVIKRPEKNSPSIISKFYDPKEIIKAYPAKTFDAEINWVCENIIDDIKEEKLLPEDILIISLDDKNTKIYFDNIESVLAESNIFVNNILNSYTGDTFSLQNKITFSTVYRAKGNEAPMVYIVGGDALNNMKNNIIGRNKLFTAFTRAKGWLRFSGMGTEFNMYITEIEKAIEKIPNMEFVYPGAEEINTHRRELTKEHDRKNRERRILMDKISEMGMDPQQAMELLKGETRNKGKGGDN